MEQVNLLPWRQKRRQRNQQTGQYGFLALTLGLLLIGLMVSQGLADQLVQQQQHWQVAQQRHRQLQISAAAHRREITPNRLRSPEHPAVGLLERLPTLIPSGIYLQQFTWRSSQIALQGNALSYTLLAQLIDKLQRQPLIPKVQLLQANLEPEQVPTALIQFQLQGDWRQGENAP